MHPWLTTMIAADRQEELAGMAARNRLARQAAAGSARPSSVQYLRTGTGRMLIGLGQRVGGFEHQGHRPHRHRFGGIAVR